MPIQNGNYVSPVWNNNAAPAINATELNAITQTVAESQMLSGSGAPTTSTVGVVGQRYKDTSTTPNAIYVCISASSASYLWVEANSSAYDSYDNSVSGLQATNVQDAIDEAVLTLDAKISARYTATQVFNTITDVHTDTTITIDQSYNNFKFLMIIFNTTSTGAAGKRMPLVLPINAIPQGGFYPLINTDGSGYIRINYVSGQTKQIRFHATSFTSLYVTSISGLT